MALQPPLQPSSAVRAVGDRRSACQRQKNDGDLRTRRPSAARGLNGTGSARSSRDRSGRRSRGNCRSRRRCGRRRRMRSARVLILIRGRHVHHHPARCAPYVRPAPPAAPSRMASTLVLVDHPLEVVAVCVPPVPPVPCGGGVPPPPGLPCGGVGGCGLPPGCCWGGPPPGTPIIDRSIDMAHHHPARCAPYAPAVTTPAARRPITTFVLVATPELPGPARTEMPLVPGVGGGTATHFVPAAFGCVPGPHASLMAGPIIARSITRLPRAPMLRGREAWLRRRRRRQSRPSWWSTCRCWPAGTC